VFPLALRAQNWSPKPELHQRRSAYKADALLSELFGHKKKKPPIVSEALDVCKRPAFTYTPPRTPMALSVRPGLQ
jgi:hypothetical protein